MGRSSSFVRLEPTAVYQIPMQVLTVANFVQSAYTYIGTWGPTWATSMTPQYAAYDANRGDDTLSLVGASHQWPRRRLQRVPGHRVHADRDGLPRRPHIVHLHHPLHEKEHRREVSLHPLLLRFMYVAVVSFALLLLTDGLYLAHRPAAHHHSSLPRTGMAGRYSDTRTRELHTSICAAAAQARVTWGHLEHPLRATKQCAHLQMLKMLHTSTST
ncbi:hypothetical protein BDN71DRAFT_597232 [Pleurotus eryngii]|uniref:Uncharacterized protein n=1 Tax=Pleurotus eryngii TaxID=5323 RepID=A0A9P6D1R7_PLEER|nr:hypothetical protein BDN71DRAFT_597232 [Pleurotus eryngii]